MEIMMPNACKAKGFSLFITQANKIVITGIVATTREIFVALVYCAPKYTSELYTVTLGIDNMNNIPKFCLINTISFLRCGTAKGRIKIKAKTQR